MNIVMLHHHLNHGGVTRVIANHLRSLDAALSEKISVLVLHGGRCDAWDHRLADALTRIDLSIDAIDGLDYHKFTNVDCDAIVLALESRLRTGGFASEDTILHIHNHTLGKNARVSLAVAKLSAAGWPLLCQLHDFAEDFRPANYLHLEEVMGESLETALYPNGAHCHYATLNGRDHARLLSAGLDADHLHFLPNPVPDFPPLPDAASAGTKLGERFQVPPDSHNVLYPVRGIQRKNLGEFVLWSVVAPKHWRFLLTLAPENEAELPQYNYWKQLARSLELPVCWETGGEGGLSFHENLAVADEVITTSVTEGFGLAFLECWKAGRPLIGRDLPEITKDFVAQGLELSALDSKVLVPTAWLDIAGVKASFVESFQRIAADYCERELFSAADLEDAFAAKTENGLIDFADLHVAGQRAVIERLHTEQQAGAQFLALNPRMAEVFESKTDSSAVITNNRNVAEKSFSVQAIGQRLLGVYRRILAGDVSATAPATSISPRQLLAEYLSPQQFQLVRRPFVDESQ